MKKISVLVFIIGVISLVSCTSEDQVYPKPLSGMKMNFPDKKYDLTVNGCHFSFTSPTYSKIDTSKGNCNLNINYHPFNASLYLTYLKIDTGLINQIEYSRTLVYEHSIQADAIEEKTIINHKNRVFGTAYKLTGNSASNYQFYLTDSLNHFIRGALYINSKPNYDSLKPIIDYLITDFDQIFNSLTWD